MAGAMMGRLQSHLIGGETASVTSVYANASLADEPKGRTRRAGSLNASLVAKHPWSDPDNGDGPYGKTPMCGVGRAGVLLPCAAWRRSYSA